ncbi:hypothetical protein PPUJ13061_30550 [Pseudomonas putida]|nr:hypothetical protein PPUJ13061_30550 [Pseudomonas putida]
MLDRSCKLLCPQRWHDTALCSDEKRVIEAIPETGMRTGLPAGTWQQPTGSKVDL